MRDAEYVFGGGSSPRAIASSAAIRLYPLLASAVEAVFDDAMLVEDGCRFIDFG